MPFNGRVSLSIQDKYNTPKNAWEDILQYIPKTQALWLPFYHDGSAKAVVESLGYTNVYHEHRDFFTYDNEGLCIDNPPFSIKEKIIKKLMLRNKPFSLLLPLDTLERKYMKKYIQDLQIVIPASRYSYVEDTDDKKSKPPFKSCWFCWNMQEFLQTNEKLIFL